MPLTQQWCLLKFLFITWYSLVYNSQVYWLITFSYDSTLGASLLLFVIALFIVFIKFCVHKIPSKEVSILMLIHLLIVSAVRLPYTKSIPLSQASRILLQLKGHCVILFCSNERSTQMILLWAEPRPGSLGHFYFWLSGRSTCVTVLELTTAHYMQSWLWHHKCSTKLTSLYLTREFKFHPGFHWISIN